MASNERENELQKTQSGNSLPQKNSAEKVNVEAKSKEKSAKEKKADRSEKSKKKNISVVFVGDKKESSMSKGKTPLKESEQEEPGTKTSEDKLAKKQKETKDNDKKKKEEEEEDDERGYGPQHAIRVLVPVTICICIVVFLMMTVYLGDRVNLDLVRSGLNVANVMKEGKENSLGSNVWRAVVNALIILGAVAVMTCVLLFFYWMKWYKLLWGYLFLGMTFGFFITNFQFLTRVFFVYSIPISLITFVILDLNMIIIGALTVFWKGPMRYKQGFMIFFCLAAALMLLTVLPTYTTWIVLGLLVLWDIFAVLAPFKFVELAQERDEKGNGPLAALVYTSGMAYFEDLNDMRSAGGKEKSKETNEKSNEKEGKSKEILPKEKETKTNEDDHKIDEMEKNEKEEKRGKEGKSDDKKAKEKKSETNQDKNVDEKQKKVEDEEEEPEEKNIQLGLGDFVFYSLLIGKSCETGCWSTILACYLTIISGLLLTLMLLIMHKRALPALPISITFGLIFYFAGEYAMLPFQNSCNRIEMIF